MPEANTRPGPKCIPASRSNNPAPGAAGRRKSSLRGGGRGAALSAPPDVIRHLSGASCCRLGVPLRMATFRLLQAGGDSAFPRGPAGGASAQPRGPRAADSPGGRACGRPPFPEETPGPGLGRRWPGLGRRWPGRGHSLHPGRKAGDSDPLCSGRLRRELRAAPCQRPWRCRAWNEARKCPVAPSPGGTGAPARLSPPPKAGVSPGQPQGGDGSIFSAEV